MCTCVRVCLCRGVGVRRQECVVMQGHFSSNRWAKLSTYTLKTALWNTSLLSPFPKSFCGSVLWSADGCSLTVQNDIFINLVASNQWLSHLIDKVV